MSGPYSGASFFISMAFAMTALAGCSTNATPTLATAAPIYLPHAGTRASPTSGYLYVGSWPGFGIGYDGATKITDYAPGSTEPAQTFAAAPWNPNTRSIAFDRVGDLYVADDYWNSVEVFGPGKTWPDYVIGWGLNKPTAMTFDRSGNLYVLNSPGWGGYVPAAGSVSVYARGKTTPKYTITKGITYAWTMALDSAENLYVANCPSCSVFAPPSKKRRAPGTISVYAHGNSTPARTIASGVAGPNALAFDSAGNLYVANVGKDGLNGSYSAVEVYAPGSSAPSRTITVGLDFPSAVAFDVTGNLWAANYKAGTVTEYTPGQSSVSQTISTAPW
ncbi:MAG: hypothetical protein JO175_03470, partial [Candidatus Eremiobacteraeota bacterium]|nr:hypothetical protein [Candidatus Eremiobacteraeota bacterium]